MKTIEITTRKGEIHRFSLKETGDAGTSNIFGDWQLAAQTRRSTWGEVEIQIYDPNTKPDYLGRIWPKTSFTLTSQHPTQRVHRGFLGLGGTAQVGLNR